MSLSNKVYTYDKLGSVAGSGLDIALFPQIRNAIANRMKEIYGNDIDLSTASADGQYINMEALITNNMYNLISMLYSNLNPNTASGQYLDILCSLCNITRKSATKSTAQLYVKYIGTGNYVPDTITVMDRDGVEWIWTNPTSYQNLNEKQYTFEENADPYLLIFECKKEGANQAFKGDYSTTIEWSAPDFLEHNGSIYLPVEYGVFKVYQIENAVVGENAENDNSLRTRKNRYIGENSLTTYEGLESALYNFNGVEDVFVGNSVTGTETNFGDDVEVPLHDIYVCVRYKDGLDSTALDSEIANIIYRNLTPGVKTCPYNTNTGQGGTAKAMTFYLAGSLYTTINWKKCTSVKPQIIINYNKTDAYTTANNQESIKTSLLNYLNNVKINDTVLSSNIQQAFLAGNIKVNGYNTAFPTSCTIDGEGSYDAPLTYLQYNASDFVFDEEHGTLTIG